MGQKVDIREVGEILKKCHFHYGYVSGDPDIHSNPSPSENIIAIDLWTDPLPVPVGEPEDPKFSFALWVAEKYSVSLMCQDFSKGGQRPKYRVVFGTSCKNITETEVEEGIRNLDLAQRNLKDGTESKE